MAFTTAAPKPTVTEDEGEFNTSRSLKDLLSHSFGFNSKPVNSRVFWFIWLGAFLLFLLQAPGREVFDTKLDLVINPTGLLSSLWHIWDGQRYQGTLQDQY
ncbi:MAG: DUF3367 domain-containing protein, partial [Acidimicrobiales bacterium]|nr:DUF3367 domain-containing protein [Acidimicrobiales bacterium]